MYQIYNQPQPYQILAKMSHANVIPKKANANATDVKWL